jgi:hypothetical protein
MPVIQQASQYQLSYATPSLATMPPTELRCSLQSYAATYRATLQLTEIRRPRQSCAAPCSYFCIFVTPGHFVVQDWLKEQEAIMEKNGEENIDLHIERLTIATVSCVRYRIVYNKSGEKEDLCEFLVS